MSLRAASDVDGERAEIRRIAATENVVSVEDTGFGRKYTLARDRLAEVVMKFRPLDTVVLVHDVPQLGLLTGDVGAVVEVYDAGTLEVEFVRPSGGTQALVTLERSDVRSVTKTDVLSVRAS